MDSSRNQVISNYFNFLLINFVMGSKIVIIILGLTVCHNPVCSWVVAVDSGVQES